MTFILMRQIVGNRSDLGRAIPAEIQRNLERKFGLDKPWHEYLQYVKNVVTFDLGPSLVLRNRDVNDIVKEHFKVSLELGAFPSSSPSSASSSAPYQGSRANSWVDYTAMFVSNVGYALPSFLVATLLIYFFALQWDVVCRRAAGTPGRARSCR